MFTHHIDVVLQSLELKPTISENDVHVLVTSRILTMLFAYVAASYRKLDDSLCFRGMRIAREEVGVSLLGPSLSLSLSLSFSLSLSLFLRLILNKIQLPSIHPSIHPSIQLLSSCVCKFTLIITVAW